MRFDYYNEKSQCTSSAEDKKNIQILENEIKKIDEEILELDPKKNNLAQLEIILKEEIYKRLISKQKLESFTNPSYKFNSNFDTESLKEFNLVNYIQKCDETKMLFWTKHIYEIIQNVRQPDLDSYDWGEKVTKLFQLCKNGNLDKVWNVFIYLSKKEIISYNFTQFNDYLFSLKDSEYSLESGCLYQYIDYVMYHVYEINWLSNHKKMNMLQEALVLSIISRKLNFPDSKLVIDQGLCEVLRIMNIFDSAVFEDFEEESDGITGKFILDGFTMVSENQNTTSHFEHIFKAFEFLLINYGYSLRHYADFNAIVWTFENNDFCPKEAQYFLDFKSAYYDYLQVCETYKTSTYTVEIKNCITDEEACLLKYNKLVRKCDIDAASYIYAINAFKRHNLIKLWKSKTNKAYSVITNKNFLFTFGKAFDISYQNIDKISNLVPLCELIDECTNNLYNCYYMKKETKSLDFHFLWSIFEEIQEIKGVILKKGTQTEEFTEIELQLEKKMSTDKLAKKALLKYKTELKSILRELEQWSNSNISKEDVNKLLEEQFSKNRTKLSEKLKLITKRKNTKSRKYK